MFKGLVQEKIDIMNRRQKILSEPSVNYDDPRVKGINIRLKQIEIIQKNNHEVKNET